MIDRDSDVRVGLLLLAAHEARLVEWRPRGTEEVRLLALGDVAGDERELRGPSASHPHGASGAAPGAHSGQQRDLHARRLERHRAALIEDFSTGVAGDARTRAWPLVLVTGDPRLTHVAARSLRQHDVPVAESSRILGWLAPAALADAVEPDVEAALAELVEGRASA